MKKSVRWIIAAGAAIAVTLVPVPAFAQEQPSNVHELTGFWLTTPHPELAIRPGETETIPLTNLPPQPGGVGSSRGLGMVAQGRQP